MSTVYIGNAVADENGNAKGGSAGNQTRKELRIQKWYLSSKGWRVLRAKSSDVAKKLAYDMRAACNNKHIGYDQSQRNTLYTAASKVGFDCAKVTTDCETDCSALVRVCLAYAGIVVPNFSTSSEAARLLSTGKFVELKDNKYTKQSEYLREGDILITSVKGHTCIVLNNGSKADDAGDTPEPPKPSPTPTTDSYVLVLGSVHVRESAPSGKVIYTAHKGKKLPYLGTTITVSDGGEWYYVESPVGNGYISAFTNKQKKYTKLVTQK